MTLLASGTFNSTATNDTFTANDTTDRITSTSPHNLNNGDQIYLTTTGTLPAGLSTSNQYYVINAGASDFQVCASAPFGTAINITDTGTGTHTWTNAKSVISVDFTAKTHLKIIIDVVGVASANVIEINFNSDGGTNYNSIASLNGAASGVQAGQRVFSVTGGSTFTPAAYGTIDIINVAANNKRGNFHTTTSDSGGELDDLVLGGFVWENTSAQISRINVILGDGFNVGFGAGSTVYVYGMD